MEIIADTEFWLKVSAIIALLLFSGFFSGSETALTAVSRGQLRVRSDKGDKSAQDALDITDDREKLIGAILLGNNFVNVLSASLATALLTSIFSESGIWIATIVMTVMILIFSEVLPKTYAIAHSETVATNVAKPLKYIIIVLTPIVLIVRAIVRGILRIFGSQTQVNLEALAHEEIAGAITQHHYEGGVEKQDRDRLLGALDLKNRTVEEIMKHRSHIEMIDKSTDPAEILAQCLASPFTRMPIFEGETENIVGVLHAKDLLREVNRLVRNNTGNDVNAVASLDILTIAMEPYFVPETTPLDDQMRAFLHRKSHFALVVDEYGELQGLITLEDILEEIVGEISDEHDHEETAFELASDGSYLLDGAMTIRDANREFEWNLPDDEANTIAGLIMHEAMSIPSQGQKFSFFGYRFEIVERERNRLTKISARKVE